MSQFFISCKESRIENNRSFYGCFYLGPFEPSQSITIANALRRTLLSEIYGLGIVSVQIEGASHEYSSLPGVRDSVLDILLNLKEIVLKKTIKNFKPQIGYLRVRGPGVVRASHLRLPPFIQCVDPNQYIATLADNGFLNMKFIIQYGNKSCFPPNVNTSPSNITQREQITNGEKDEAKNLYTGEAMSAFNTHVKKRRLILKKLKQMVKFFVREGSYIKMLSQSARSAIKARKENYQNRRALKLVGLSAAKKYAGRDALRTSPTASKLSKLIEKQINLPAGFAFKHDKKLARSASWLRSNALFKKKLHALPPKSIKNAASHNGKTQATHNVSEALSSSTFNQSYTFKANPLNIDAIFNPIKKVNYIIEINDFKAAPQKMLYEIETSELYEMLKNSNLLNSTILEKELDSTRPDSKNSNKINVESFSPTLRVSQLSDMNKGEIDHILEIKREINALKKETTKHNITLEIWTNGSMHPRDALYQGFKNLINIFVKLKKINTVINKTLLLDSELQKQNLLKKIKMDQASPQSNLIQELKPVNLVRSTKFLSTYVAPKIKNYYLNVAKAQSSTLTGIKNQTRKNTNAAALTMENNPGTSDLVLNENKLATSKELNTLDIGVLNLSLRCYTFLKRLNINTVSQLLDFQLRLQNNISDNSENIKLNKSLIEEINRICLNLGALARK